MNNWLKKIAIPIKVNDYLYQIAIEASNVISSKNYTEFKNNDVFHEMSILIKGKPETIVFAFSTNDNFFAQVAYHEKVYYMFISSILFLQKKDFIIEIILHELIHVLDPKLSDENLTHKEWGVRHHQGSDDLDEYFKYPWEQDAYMSSYAFSVIKNWHERGFSYNDSLELLKKFKPFKKFEHTYYKNPKLWQRYLKTLAYYLTKIYENERPKNKIESDKLRHQWESNNDVSTKYHLYKNNTYDSD